MLTSDKDMNGICQRAVTNMCQGPEAPCDVTINYTKTVAFIVSMFCGNI